MALFPGLKSGATTSTEPDGSAWLRRNGIAMIIRYWILIIGY
jgi:hypothetical protein